MSTENRYMQRALELARKGEGFTHPNPMVGAVIVRGGQVIAEGYHHGPREDLGRRWQPAEVGDAVARLVAAMTPPAPVYGTQ